MNTNNSLWIFSGLLVIHVFSRVNRPTGLQIEASSIPNDYSIPHDTGVKADTKNYIGDKYQVYYSIPVPNMKTYYEYRPTIESNVCCISF